MHRVSGGGIFSVPEGELLGVNIGSEKSPLDISGNTTLQQPQDDVERRALSSAHIIPVQKFILVADLLNPDGKPEQGLDVNLHKQMLAMKFETLANLLITNSKLLHIHCRNW